MKKRSDGVYAFQQGDFVDMGGTTVIGQRPDSGLGPTSYSGFDFFGTNRDPYMGGYTGFSPDLNAILFGSLDPTGVVIDQNAIANSIDEFVKDFYRSEGDLSQGDIKSRQERLLTGVYEKFGDEGLIDFLNLRPRNVPPVGGPNDPNFTWDAYNAIAGPATNAVLSAGPQGVGPTFTPASIAPAQDAVDLATSLTGTGVTAPVTGAAPVVTPPANPPGILSTVTGAIKNTADALLKSVQDMFPFWNQAQVVINPVSGKATIVLGAPPSGAPVVQAGTLPRSNTNVGVTTGIPFLDQAINSALGRSGGMNAGSIKEEIIKVIADQAGVDAATAAAVIGGDLDEIASTVNTVLADQTTRFGVDLTKDKEGGAETEAERIAREAAATNTNTDTDVEDILTTGTTTTGTTTTGTNNISDTDIKNVVTTGTSTNADTNLDGILTRETPNLELDKVLKRETPNLELDNVLKRETPNLELDKVLRVGDTDVLDLGNTPVLTPADLGEADVIRNVPPPKETEPPKDPRLPELPQQLFGQGIRGMKTEQAGLAEIEPMTEFDALYDDLLRILSGGSDTEANTYYDGGQVQPRSQIDEIVRLLRG